MDKLPFLPVCSPRHHFFFPDFFSYFFPRISVPFGQARGAVRFSLFALASGRRVRDRQPSPARTDLSPRGSLSVSFLVNGFPPRLPGRLRLSLLPPPSSLPRRRYFQRSDFPLHIFRLKVPPFPRFFSSSVDLLPFSFLLPTTAGM